MEESNLKTILSICFDDSRERLHGTLVFSSFEEWYERITFNSTLLGMTIEEYLIYTKTFDPSDNSDVNF